MALIRLVHRNYKPTARAGPPHQIAVRVEPVLVSLRAGQGTATSRRLPSVACPVRPGRSPFTAGSRGQEALRRHWTNCLCSLSRDLRTQLSATNAHDRYSNHMTRKMTATEVKAKILSLLDEVAAGGE